MGSTQDIVADIIDFRLADDADDAFALVVRTPARPALAAGAALGERDLFGDAGIVRLQARAGMLQLRGDARS